MGTPSLRELQGAFWRAIASEPGTLRAGSALLAATGASRTLAAEGRLQVYVEAYFLRLREVLAEDFPRLAAVLDCEDFTELTRDYLRQHPSVRPSVRHVGDALPGFLAMDARRPAYLADLARLERARTNVFDAPDDTPIGLDALRAIDAAAWPELRFTPVRALVLLHLDWPVQAVWSDGTVAPTTRTPTTLRIWRGADYRVFHAPVEPRAALALERLAAGERFASICAAFEDLPEAEGARQAVALLARWIDDGLIAGVRSR